jgi:hypothetical protein
MPRGDKSSFTDKQKRQAEHIEEGYQERGGSRKEAARRASATQRNATVKSGARKAARER